MKHILLSFVGNQDPCSEGSQEEGSIVTICRHIRPDEVHLFPSARLEGARSFTEDNARETAEWLHSFVQEDLPLQIQPLSLRHPEEFADVLPAARTVILSLLKKYGSENISCHLNVSSGTPAMKASMFLFAASGLLPQPHLWKVADPRFINSQEERIVELTPSFLEEESIISRLQENAKQCLFESMAQDCRRLAQISLHPDRREKALLLAKLFTSYHQWDLIQYKDAHHQLSEVYRTLASQPAAAFLRPRLQKQVDFLAALQKSGEKESPQGLLDLQLNAQRRFARGDYTDTLARFWRVYEGSLYLRLRTAHGIDRQQWRACGDADSLRRLQLYFQSQRYEPEKLNRWQAHEILSTVFTDTVFSSLLAAPAAASSRLTVDQKLKHLGEKRNDSIVAHGMRPVSRQEATDALHCMELLVTQLLGFTAPAAQHHPLQAEDLFTILSLLDAVDA